VAQKFPPRGYGRYKTCYKRQGRHSLPGLPSMI